MTIIYKKGCLIQGLFDGEVDAIAHQANCFNTMGSGVAKTIKAYFPAAYTADRVTKRGDINKLGTYTVSHKPFTVYNLYGQYNYGRANWVVYTKYSALKQALEACVDDLVNNLGKRTLGIPKIGCGLAGGDWDIVEEQILKKLEGIDIVVYEL